MFILSIVPIPMNAGNSGKLNENNLTSIEKRIEDLEALLTAEILQQDAGVIVDGYDNDVNTSDRRAIMAELKSLRQKDIELRKATGGDSNVDEAERLKEIEAKQTEGADVRIKDLEEFKTAILAGKEPPKTITGIDNDPRTVDIKDIDKEIERAKAYKAELQSFSDFWKTISDGHVGETDTTQNTKPLTKPEATDPAGSCFPPKPHPGSEPTRPTEGSDPTGGGPENKKQGDINGDGKLDTKDYDLLKKAINGSVELSDEEKKIADMNSDGIIDKKDLKLLEGAVNKELFYQQIQIGLKYVLEDVENGIDITAKDYESSFANHLFAYLKDLTGVPISASKKAEILKYISKIADGSAEDLNSDGKFNADDLIKLWDSAEDTN